MGTQRSSSRSSMIPKVEISSSRLGKLLQPKSEDEANKIKKLETTILRQLGMARAAASMAKKMTNF